jgi:hypothetical protein
MAFHYAFMMFSYSYIPSIPKCDFLASRFCFFCFHVHSRSDLRCPHCYRLNYRRSRKTKSLRRWCTWRFEVYQGRPWRTISKICFARSWRRWKRVALALNIPRRPMPPLRTCPASDTAPKPLNLRLDTSVATSTSLRYDRSYVLHTDYYSSL